MNLRDELLAIREKHGELTPALVLDEAREESHPLHDRFEWDDGVAAEKFRRHQAHRLIRVAQLPVSFSKRKNAPTHLRAFVATPRGSDPQPDYMPVEDAMSDEFTRALVLQAMEREIAALKRKYGHLKEFAAAISQIAQGA
jgi:hypothetical protein